MIAFYMDVHVPRAISEQLRLRGVDVLTAQQDGTTEWEDTDLLNRALTLGRVVFTQDQDFLLLTAERQNAAQPFAGILFVEQRRVTIVRYVIDLELIAKAVNPEDFTNRLERLPL